MSNNTVTLHRVLKTTPEKVFRAFTEPAAIASWLPPYGFLCTVHEMNVKPGGTHKMSFQNFTTGNGHSFGGTYLEVKPNELIEIHRQIRRSKFAGRNDLHCYVNEKQLRVPK